MKNILYIGIFFLAVVLSSCSDFLNKESFTDPSPEYINDEATLIALVNGAYQPLQRPKLYNMRIWTLDIMAGNSEVGAGGGDDGIETIQLSNFVTASDNAAVIDIWRGPNPGILYCNTVLKNAPNMNNVSAAIRERSIGEAKFLRAHYYFILVQLFGDVPLLVDPLEPGDDIYPSRTDKNIVYNDLIIPDLKDAIDLLPTRDEYGMEDLGRASKGSAAGMLAKVYLTLGKYDECLKMIQIVEDLGYKLNPDYSDCFGGQAQHKNTLESLFEVQYFGLTKAGFWDDDNQANWLSTYMGPRNSGWVGGGYGWNQPTQEFVDQYEEGDVRKEKTILYEGCPPFDGKKYKKSMSNTGYNVRKFLVPLSVSPDYNTNSASIVVLRYADVLLMKAEALNELGRTEEAVEPLYEVRKRAKLTDKSTIVGLSQTEMREKILKERRIELAFEGHRWFDMIRIDEGQYALNFLHSIGKVNASRKHLLLPIPQKDIDANTNLKQNPGY
ncbi:MAG: RagB/SusD family nutrient uptake outer membrane protein [Bacteroides sp.]|nr:RagB/SusD family nutrient uptake outer membrane protein [Bacteroides sp.]MDD2645752.1 RagB/SusD family nutrient uptake outer membrane protein [Bacteroides sp.]MDD4054868.1 RagB/SusD family nutrient uptake outer membrane protein [Bacteroides sp.]